MVFVSAFWDQHKYLYTPNGYGNHLFDSVTSHTQSCKSSRWQTLPHLFNGTTWNKKNLNLKNLKEIDESLGVRFLGRVLAVCKPEDLSLITSTYRWAWRHTPTISALGGKTDPGSLVAGQPSQVRERSGLGKRRL